MFCRMYKSFKDSAISILVSDDIFPLAGKFMKFLDQHVFQNYFSSLLQNYSIFVFQSLFPLKISILAGRIFSPSQENPLVYNCIKIENEEKYIPHVKYIPVSLLIFAPFYVIFTTIKPLLSYYVYY